MKKTKILSYICDVITNATHNITLPKSVNVSILMHGIISLLYATSYDKELIVIIA